MKKLFYALLFLLLFPVSAYSADTITILDALTNAQASATSDFYTIDVAAASANNSAVGMFVVQVPDTANRVRVIYNNQLDTGGTGDAYTRCRISSITDVDPFTKAVAAVDVFAKVAAGVTSASVREGATTDISANIQTVLYIDVCLSEAGAVTNGLRVQVQISSATSGDSFWEDLTTFQGPVGTVIKVDLGVDEAAGQTELSVTNPVASNLDIQGKWIFLEDTATPANSEIVFQVANSGD